MKWDTVSLVGVGLIGGSIGLALRERGGARRVIGIGRNRASLAKARRCGAVDLTTTRLERGVAEADLVVICTPVEHIVPLALAVAEHCPAQALITDVGSTKERIVRQLESRWQADSRFVGSHPLAGSDQRGAQHARSDLFQGRVTVVTPTARTQPGDTARVEAFWRALGAEVLRMSTRQHDREVAAISHLPHLVAAALAAATPTEATRLAAGGWLDTTRIARGDVEMWRQILCDNRSDVLKSLSNFEKVFNSFRRALESDNGTRLAELLIAGKRNRDAVGN